MSAINSDQKLYIMKNTLGLRKIGISKNPTARAKEISNNSGFKTEVEKVIDVQDAYKVEQLLHKHFAQYRMEGEWFKDIPARELSKKNIKRVYTKVLAMMSRNNLVETQVRFSTGFEIPCTRKDCISGKDELRSVDFEKIMGYKCYWMEGGRFNYVYKFHSRLLEDFPEAFVKAYGHIGGDVIRGKTIAIKEIIESSVKDRDFNFKLYLNKGQYLRYVRKAENRAIKKVKERIKALENYVKDYEEWDGEDLDSIPMMHNKAVSSLDYL